MRRDLLLEARSRSELAEMDPAERRLWLRRMVIEAQEPDAPATVASLADDIDGFGPLTALMGDPRVSDVLVNSPEDVWVERSGRLVKADVRFSGAEDVRELAVRLVTAGGERLDAGSPIADARLRDGSRVHAVLPPVAPHPILSIRRFPASRFELHDLEVSGFVTTEQASALRTAVLERRAIVVAGPTGSGKTTLVDALLTVVPDHERVVIVEEVPELRPRCRHCVSLLTRRPNVEGTGGIDLTDLVRAALRMRPDRLVVGEVRGAEALPALDAMSTGHEGGLLTVHARSAREVAARLTALALQAGSGESESSIAARVRSAVQVVVFLGRVDGRRCVRDIVGL